MCDVGGYGTCVASIYLGLVRMKTMPREGCIELAERIGSLYHGLKARYDEIDLESLDERFPTEVIHKLKSDVIPRLGEELDKLTGLLQEEPDVIHSSIDSCLKLVREMQTLGMVFLENERYVHYRRMHPERRFIEVPFSRCSISMLCPVSPQKQHLLCLISCHLSP